MSTAITSGNAITITITIATSNVTIDLNGYKLGGLAAGAGAEATGIYALNRNNITDRRGHLRMG